MNLFMIITLILISLLILAIAISLIFNIKNSRKLLPKFRLRNSIRLNRSLRHLLAKADRKTRRSFKTSANFFVHVNTSNAKLIEKETSKTLGIELYKSESLNYNQYLSDKSYVLELHKLNDDHIYKEIGKFCNKVSSITGEIPTLVYSFEYQKIKNESLILEEIKSLRSIIIQLTKTYKKIPNLVLSIADIEKHPGYKTFIECVSTYNIPLISPPLNPNNLNVEINNQLKKLNLLANNLLFKKHPEEFLRFAYFINDIFDHFKYLLNKQSYLDSNKSIQNISLYLNNTKSNINQSLFQSTFKAPQYRTTIFKKALWTGIGVALAIIGVIFTINILTYKTLIKEYRQELFAIPDDKSKSSQQTIKLSNYYKDDVNTRLIGNTLYPNIMIRHGIEVDEGLKIQQQILGILEASKPSEDSTYNTFLFLTLIASQNNDLQKLIKSNIHVWSMATKLPEETISTYINASVPNINANISNINTNELSYKNIVIRSNTYNLIKDYITENSNINLKTLHVFLNKIDLPMTKQQIISKFMKKIFPQIKDSLSEYNKKFLEKLYGEIENTPKSLDEIKQIEKSIPAEKETKVNNLQAALDLLTDLNNKLDKKLDDDTNINPIWYKAIFQATYNDVMNNLSLSKAKLVDSNTIKQAIVNVGDNGGYYGNISIVYTKTGLKEVILPEIASYKSISKLLESHNMSTSAIKKYYDNAIQTYINNYKESYIELIASYKNSINTNDLISSLFLISSTSSQFNNMLKTLADNTVFDKNHLKEIPQLSLIGSFFQNVDRMISNPNDMDKYNQIIREIANEINDADNKREVINKITLNLYTRSKDSYYYKINSLIKKNHINKENSVIFMAPLQSIMEFGKPYLIKHKYKIWDKDIVSLIEKNQAYFPFSDKSDKKITPKELTKIFAPSGKFWTIVKKDMYGIFEYKNGKWQSKIPNLFGQNTIQMLDTLNNVQKLTDTLWDKSGKPKPLDITLKVMPTPNNLLQNNTFVKMTLLSIGSQKAVGISTEQKPIILNYNWFEQQPSSIGYIDSNEKINSIETHSSYWSFITLLNEAEKNGDTYTWNQNNIAIKFKINFDNVFKNLNN